MQSIIQATVLILLGIVLSGCANHADLFNQWASAQGASAEIIETSRFPLMSVSEPNLGKKRSLAIYIEGDGRAWATSSQPSTDPSPRHYLMADFAINGRHPGIYLARPCQFVMTDKCTTKLWTDQRFGREVVDSFHDALNAFKVRHGAMGLELIGYSGGATIALLLAAERKDVTHIQTLAGNVDPDAWIERHGLTALKGSLDPLVYADKLGSIKQRHYVGTRDSVIPSDLVKQFIDKTQARCAEVIEVTAGHATGWGRGIEFDAPIICESLNQSKAY